MELSKRQKIALDYFQKGFNYSQSVVAAFLDVLNIDKQTAINMASPLGGGFVGTRNLCGTVVSMGIIYSIIKNHSSLSESKKQEIYREVKVLIEEFQSRNNTLICSELLKHVKELISGTIFTDIEKEAFAKRPCAKFVLDAVNILENSLDL